MRCKMRMRMKKALDVGMSKFVRDGLCAIGQDEM